MNTLLCGCVLAVIVLTYPAATGHNQGNPSFLEDVPRNVPIQASRDPHDSNGFLREKVRNENDILVRKRDWSPPKSPGLSLEALLSRAKTILQVLHDEGCPTIEETIFNVTVYTADLRLAGTTSRVYINLYGMMYGLEQSTEKIHLTNNDTKEFKRARVDSFVVKTKFVGLIERITIEHDNTGFFPDWNLHKVVVEDLKIGTVQTYTCDCEMSGYENEVTLPPI